MPRQFNARNDIDPFTLVSQAIRSLIRHAKRFTALSSCRSTRKSTRTRHLVFYVAAAWHREEKVISPTVRYGRPVIASATLRRWWRVKWDFHFAEKRRCFSRRRNIFRTMSRDWYFSLEEKRAIIIYALCIYSSDDWARAFDIRLSIDLIKQGPLENLSTMMTGLATAHKKFISTVIYFLRRARRRPLISFTLIFSTEESSTSDRVDVATL